MLNDIGVMRQMYAALCGGADDAEGGNVWTAKEVLQQAEELLYGRRAGRR